MKEKEQHFFVPQKESALCGQWIEAAPHSDGGGHLCGYPMFHEIHADRFDKGCVSIDDCIPECCEECGDEATGQPPAVKAVRMLLPTLGMDMIVGKYCDACSKLVCERLQASLPDEVEE